MDVKKSGTVQLFPIFHIFGYELDVFLVVHLLVGQIFAVVKQRVGGYGSRNNIC